MLGSCSWWYQHIMLIRSELQCHSGFLFIFFFRALHLCINVGEGKTVYSFWNVMSVNKICTCIWDLVWHYNSIFKINYLSFTNTFHCFNTSICFWNEGRGMGGGGKEGGRKERKQLGSFVLWYFSFPLDGKILTGIRFCYSGCQFTNHELNSSSQVAPSSKTGISQNIGRSREQLLILNV